MVKQPDIHVKDTLNYQNNCRNTFGWLMNLSYSTTLERSQNFTYYFAGIMLDAFTIYYIMLKIMLA